MKLTVLVDNNTIIDEYYLAEPALSYLIEENGKKILFDTGYSNVFMKNAKSMNIDLSSIDYLVFSHGHNDHTGGVKYLFDIQKDIEVFCHSEVDNDKYFQGLNVGMEIKLNKFPSNFKINKRNEYCWLTDNILYLGQIDRTIQKVNGLENDLLLDDTALVYKSDDSIFIITGCSHSGIVNIIDKAKKLTGINKIEGIIGGFHLLDDLENTQLVCQYLKDENIKEIWPAHCTDLNAKIELSKVVKVNEVGVGLVINC